MDYMLFHVINNYMVDCNHLIGRRIEAESCLSCIAAASMIQCQH